MLYTLNLDNFNLIRAMFRPVVWISFQRGAQIKISTELLTKSGPQVLTKKFNQLFVMFKSFFEN